MTFGPNGSAIFNRTYSRPKGDRSETWEECVHRVVEGNLGLIDDEQLEGLEASQLAHAIHSMALLPAGRHLYSSGVPGRQFLMNCHRAGWGHSLESHFCFTFEALLTGGGVGANFSNEYLEQVAMPTGKVVLAVACSDEHPDRDEFAQHLVPSLPGAAVYRVPDSREGWVDALRQIMNLAEQGGGQLTIDVSDVRPRGSMIATFGGTASGPGPLCDLLIRATNILNTCIGRTMTSLEAMSIDHAIASCVVAGNVRRSAKMSIKSARDSDILDFITCKLDDPNAHWSTNISVEIDDLFLHQLQVGTPQATAVFSAIVSSQIANGEPGFYNSYLAGLDEPGDVRATNPCGEQPLEAWEACCLGHVNLAAFGTDLDGAIEAARLMTRFLIRATNADMPDEKQRAIVAHNRRIGVGLLGVQEWAAAHGVKWSEIPDSDELKHFISEMVQAVEHEADYYSDQLGVPRPIKTRTIAPTGTVAKLAGVSEGIHPIYARHYLQRVRYASNDSNLQEHRDKGRLIEPCLYTENTAVVTIPTRNTILDKFDGSLIESVDEIELDTLFEVQAWFQKHWSDNAVSFTANVSPDIKHQDLASALKRWLPHLKGTTVFPDLSRPQSPFQRIPDDIYRAMGGVIETGQAIDDCQGACPVR
jgi:ribonucleoside-triphosphate reductase